MGILESISANALALFLITSVIYFYFNYAQCLRSAYKTGKPAICYNLGMLIVGVLILLTASELFLNNEKFKSIAINAPSASSGSRPAAAGNLGEPFNSQDSMSMESFSPISGLSQEHRLDSNEGFNPIAGLNTPQRLGDVGGL